MRVLIDAREAPGGIQRALDELVGRLRAQASDLELVLYRPRKETNAPVRLREQTRGGLRRWLGDGKRVLEEQLTMPRFVAAMKPDIFLSPSASLPPRLPCASVVQCHDLWLLDHQKTKRGRWISRYERMRLLDALTRADRIVVPSRSIEKEMMDRFPDLRPKIRHIYLPLSQAKNEASDDRELGPTPATPFLLSVGTLEPRKNLERLLDAQDVVWPRTGVPLILVGPFGWKQKALVERIRATEGTEWLGAVDDPTLDQLYRRASALVQVSLCEGFNYPMVEALQRSTPVVLSNLPVHKEIAGDSAVFCQPTETSSIAAALETVLGWDAERRAEFAYGAARNLEALGDHRCAESWQQLLSEAS